LAAAGDEGLEPGSGSALMEVRSRSLLFAFAQYLPVGGASAIVATLYGRVERSANRIGVVVTRSSASRAIVPQVGCIVVCRCKILRKHTAFVCS
jgi:hypothetical protein